MSHEALAAKGWLPRIAPADKLSYRTIADALEQDVAEGRLAPGVRVPTMRQLAFTLDVNVGTVARAFVEAKRRGLLETHGRHGTRVVESTRPADGAAVSPMDLRQSRTVLRRIGSLYAEALRRIGDRPGFIDSLQGYGDVGGLARHQATLRDFVSKYLDLPADQPFLLTAGAQQGLHAALSTVCRPGDTVACEALTYPGLRFVAEMLGLVLAPLALDAEGLLPEELDRLCAAASVRALVCVPNHHNPTTACLSQERRRRIADLAVRHGFTVIEDDVYGYLADPVQPSISTMAPNDTITISSLSKVFSAALRVGFALVPERFVEGFSRVIRGTTWAAPAVNAEVVLDWIEHGIAGELIDETRDELQRRNRLFADRVGGLDIAQNPCGTHIWLPMAPGQSTAEFISHLAAIGISVMPAEMFWAGGPGCPRAVRINLSALPDIGAVAPLCRAIRSATARCDGSAGGYLSFA